MVDDLNYKDFVILLSAFNPEAYIYYTRLTIRLTHYSDLSNCKFVIEWRVRNNLLVFVVFDLIKALVLLVVLWNLLVDLDIE